MTPTLLPHRRQRGFDDVDGAEEVGLELLADEGQGAGAGGQLLDGTDDGWGAVSCGARKEDRNGRTFAAAAEEDVDFAKGLDGLGDGRLTLADYAARRVSSQPYVLDNFPSAATSTSSPLPFISPRPRTTPIPPAEEQGLTPPIQAHNPTPSPPLLHGVHLLRHEAHKRPRPLTAGAIAPRKQRPVPVGEPPSACHEPVLFGLYAEDRLVAVGEHRARDGDAERGGGGGEEPRAGVGVRGELEGWSRWRRGCHCGGVRLAGGSMVVGMVVVGV